ncbi:MAG: TraR/DksA C4-type zinc finger protein [Clostridia bacterium]|jgi:YteA family regulatory protein
MDQQKIENFKSTLEQKKRDAQKTLSQIENNEFNDAQAEYTSELSVYDNHPADIATETYEMEKNMALRKQNLHRINQIDQALERIERGDYGKCALCGGEIGFERLKTQPEADTCLKCSKGTRLPRERVMEGRPVEEETLNYPYNRERSGKDQRVIFDGEDSWQAVARYNRREDDPSNQTGDEQGIWDDLPAGLVEDIDSISSRYYKKQLEEDNDE